MTAASVAAPRAAGAAAADALALVTGGSRGIGSAIAYRLAADGYRVEIWYHDRADAAARVIGRIVARGGRAAAKRIDVTDERAVRAGVESLLARFGRIDVLVNNAGVMHRAAFLDIGRAAWDEVLRTNLSACFTVSQAVAREMTRSGAGAIVNITSTNDLLPAADGVAYAVSKAGVSMLTKQLALELGPHGVRANAVAPGMVETDLNRELLRSEQRRAEALGRIPTGRFATPGEVAAAVSFLVSDEAASINGLTVRVDGGRTIT